MADKRQRDLFKDTSNTRCKYCGLPIIFIQLHSGKWKPLNPNGTSHWQACKYEQQRQKRFNRESELETADEQ